jgi:molybdopterin synthase catalytic subunit
MDISKTIADMKNDPGFSENVGMVLIHNGTVRGLSRGNRSRVKSMEVIPDHNKIEEIRREIEQHEGVYKIIIEAHGGTMNPGDDLLFIVVAGDIRENVKPALALMLDRVKAEAITKKEILAGEDGI